MQYKHIIWDWNGTLLDDVWLCVQSINILLQKYNKAEVSRQSYRELFDFPVKQYYEKIGFDFDKEPFEEVGLEFINEYNKLWKNCKLHKSVTDSLKQLNDLQLTQSVLSAREKNQLTRELTFFNIHDYFIGITGTKDHYAHGKKDFGIQFIKSSGLRPAEVLFIGDTLHDYEVSRAMGVDCALLSHGHFSQHRLKKVNAPIYDDIDSLLEKML